MAHLILDNMTDVSQSALPFGTFEFEWLHAFRSVYLALIKLQPPAITGRHIVPQLQQRHGGQALSAQRVTALMTLNACCALGVQFPQQLFVAFGCALEKKGCEGQHAAADSQRH